MITDAAWLDFDGDGRLDLVTVGEWMSIQFYRNDGKRFSNVTKSTQLPPMRGWWYSLAVGDFDSDGRADLIAGNLGLNYQYQTSKESKFGVYANNFTGNQTTDVVLTQTVDGKEYPLAGMAPLGQEIYPTAVKFPTYGRCARRRSPSCSAPNSAQGKACIREGIRCQRLSPQRRAGKSRVGVAHLAQSHRSRRLFPRCYGDGHLDLSWRESLRCRAEYAEGGCRQRTRLKGDGRGTSRRSPARKGFLAPMTSRDCR